MLSLHTGEQVCSMHVESRNKKRTIEHSLRLKFIHVGSHQVEIKALQRLIALWDCLRIYQLIGCRTAAVRVASAIWEDFKSSHYSNGIRVQACSL